MRRFLIVCLAALLLFSCGATAENLPAWEYPIEPEIIDNFEQYITLANRTHLLDSGYVPDDLVKVSVRRASGVGAMELRKAANDALGRADDRAVADLREAPE